MMKTNEKIVFLFGLSFALLSIPLFLFLSLSYERKLYGSQESPEKIEIWHGQTICLKTCKTSQFFLSQLG